MDGRSAIHWNEDWAQAISEDEVRCAGPPRAHQLRPALGAARRKLRVEYRDVRAQAKAQMLNRGRGAQ
jgi:hypothetical protein